MSKKKAEQPEFLAEVLNLQDQIDALKKRLALVEENREKVRQKIYEKVKSDYEKSLQELFDKLQPFCDKINEEIAVLEGSIQEQQSIVEQNQEELEEFQLRFFAGEFGEDEYQPRHAELVSTIDEAREKITGIQASIVNFREHLAFITGEPEEEVAEPAEQEAEIMPQEDEQDEGAAVQQDEIAQEDELYEVAEPVAEYEEPEVLPVDDQVEEYQDFRPEPDIDPEVYEPDSDHVDRLMKDTVSEALFPEDRKDDAPVEVEPSDEEDYIWSGIPVLDVVDGDFTGESYTIDKERITMGRGPNNDIQLATDTSVSRHHAQIVLEDNKYFLVDLDSSNGSSVNGIRVSRAALRPNDEITIGVSKMIIRTQD